jgi:DNA-binding NarL/FixJ family response regulator
VQERTFHFGQPYAVIPPDHRFGDGYGRSADDSSALDSDADAVRVLVVEDHPGARKSICDMLLQEKGLRVISEAADGLQGVQLASALQPDVILLDITMPTLGGIEAAVRMRRVAPHARIIFVSQHNLKKLADAALATGALGYVLKSTAGTDLVPAIRAVMTGKKFVSKIKE